MAQDEISRMSKKELERQLRQVLNGAPPLPDDYDTGLAEGWNTAIEVVGKYLEPLLSEAAELEHLLGLIEGVIGSLPNKLPPMQLLDKWALDVGDSLNRVDKYNRELTALMQFDQPYMDFSPAYAYRDTLIDITSGTDKTGQRLRAVISSNPTLRKNFDIIAELFKRKERPRQDATKRIAQLMSDIIERRPSLGVVAAAQQVKDAHNLAYSVDTIVSYYYRAR